MGIQIEDGTGRGYSASVSTENMLNTTSVQSSTEHHANHEHGLAFHLLFQQTPTLNDPSIQEDTCFLYIKNTDETDMCLEGILLRLAGSNVSEIVKIVGNDTGSPVGGDNMTPSNCNLGSGRLATGVFYASNTITGLSGGTEIERIYIGSSNSSTYFNFENDIIVPKNKTITLYASTTGTEIDGSIIFNYHSTEMG